MFFCAFSSKLNYNTFLEVKCAFFCGALSSCVLDHSKSLYCLSAFSLQRATVRRTHGDLGHARGELGLYFETLWWLCLRFT